MNLMQSLQEVNRIFEEWKANFAPKDLLFTDANVNALVEYVALHFGGIVSITNLDAALANLPNLKRAPKKTALEREVEFRTKELQRRQREAAENAKPFNHAKGVQQQADKAAHHKQQETARNAINTAIESYECYRGPGRRDFTLMDQRKTRLRATRDVNKNADQVKLYALIQKMILEFPDPNERSR
jgi:hypothetical protein